jgi:hypothetical protein
MIDIGVVVRMVLFESLAKCLSQYAVDKINHPHSNPRLLSKVVEA